MLTPPRRGSAPAGTVGVLEGAELGGTELGGVELGGIEVGGTDVGGGVVAVPGTHCE